MTFSYFLKNVLQLIKNRIILITIVTLTTILLSFGLTYVVSRAPLTEPADSEEVQLLQVGHIELFQNPENGDYHLKPYIPETAIEEINSWSNFRAAFSLNSTDPDLKAEQAIIRDEEIPSNPIEDFLGLDPTQYNNVRIHPDTGKMYMTYEIDPQSGASRVVSVKEGFNDFRVQLDVDAEEGTFAEGIAEEADDLLNVKIGMTPGQAQLGYLEAAYDWKSGITYPRAFANRTYVYVEEAQPYTVFNFAGDNSHLSLRQIIAVGIISTFIGFSLGTALAFALALFEKKINYSFAYTWDSDDLFLPFSSHDKAQHVVYDMLQSSHQNLALITENPLPGDISEALSVPVPKDLVVYTEISEMPLDNPTEEFVLVVQRGKTTKEWYQRQRKHLRAFQNVAVKVVEI